MEKIINGFKSFFNKVSKNEYVRVFAIIFILGFVFFGTTALNNGLTMSFNGDYTLQTLAFYSDGYNKIWEFLRTGEFPMFDYSNFLGMNYFGTASFYYLTSPFYYLLLLFPKKYIFQGVYLLLLIKYAIGGLFFYILLKKFFNYKDRTCLVGAIVYAFSGWNLYYLWFHFADAMAIFPLFIIGLEYCLQKKKGWLITLSLFLVGLCNYFFFVTFAIFGVFYFIFRWIKLYGLTKKGGYSFFERWDVAIKGALYFIVGGLLAGFVLIPNLIVVQQSGRVEEDLLTTFLMFFKNAENVDGEIVLSGFKSFKEIFDKENLKGLYEYMFVWSDRNTNHMTIGKEQTQLYIISNFLFMNSNCWDTTVFKNSGLDNNIGGLFITTPLILLLVPTMINTFKSKKVWDIFTLIVCVIMPFVPITFYLFHGFTYEYGRWELCLVLITLIYVLKTFDNLEITNRWMFTVGIIVNVALAGYCVYYSYSIGTLDMEYRILIIIAELIFMFVVYHVSFVYHERKWFKDVATGLIIGELFVSTLITINMHGVTNYETLYGGSEVYSEEQVMIDELKEKDGSFYRIYNNMATRNYTNLPSALSYNGMSTFNSIYNQNNDKFIKRSDVWYSGGWSMGYHEKRPYFDEFVGVKYYIVDKNNLNNDSSDKTKMYDGRTAEIEQKEYAVNVPFGYEKLDTNYTNFDIYENTNFIELGFAYPNYILDNSAGEGSNSTYYETLYSNMAIIDEENKELFGDDYEEKVIDRLQAFNKTTWTNPYYTVRNSELLKTISMRNDLGLENKDLTTRDTFTVNGHHDLVSKISDEKYGAYGTMMHGRWKENGYFGDEIILTTSKRIAEFASKENPANIILNLQMGPQCLVSLYGENDELLTQDCHIYHTYSLGTRWYERKMERSYYVTKEVKKIVIEFINDAVISNDMNDSMFDLNNISVSYSYYDEYLNNWKFAKENQLQNIENTANSFSFDTNYDEQKIVCLNVPYDQGWTLKMDNEEIDIIRMNGGFIGFIAPSGMHSYYLNYVTPGMSDGLLITLGGAGLGLAVFVGYNFHYCLNVTKTIIGSTILFKKKKNEDEKENPIVDSDTLEVKPIEKEDKIEKTSKTVINVILAVISGIMCYAIANLFSNHKILVLLGLLLGYCLEITISYFIGCFFRKYKLTKEDIVKYLKNSIIGLVVIFLIYLLTSLVNLYIPYRLLISIFGSLPITYLIKKHNIIDIEKIFK